MKMLGLKNAWMLELKIDLWDVTMNCGKLGLGIQNESLKIGTDLKNEL